MAPSNSQQPKQRFKRPWLWIGAVFLVLPLLIGTLFLTGNVLRIDSPGKEAERQLAGSKGSPESLARHFLEALANRDRDKLTESVLNRQEFEQYVYPKLPASDPRANISAEFLWKQTHLRSQAGLSRTWGRHAGKKYRLLGYGFAGGEQDYDSFVIHKDTRLLVRDEKGQEQELDLFGSMIEMDGEYKIYSLVVD